MQLMLRSCPSSVGVRVFGMTVTDSFFQMLGGERERERERERASVPVSMQGKGKNNISRK